MFDLGEALGSIKERAERGMAVLVTDGMTEREKYLHEKYGIPANVDLSEEATRRTEAKLAAQVEAEVADATQRYNEWHMRIHGTMPYQVDEEFKSPPTEVVSTARRICDRLEEGVPGFFFYGRTGRGKSLMADWVLNDWTGDGWTGDKVSEKQFADAIRAEMKGFAQPGDTVARYSRPGLLVYDDIGVINPANWLVSEVYELLSRRAAGGLRTVVTCNLSLPELQEHLATGDPYNAERVASRIGAFTQLPFTGPDHRQAVKVVPAGSQMEAR